MIKNAVLFNNGISIDNLGKVGRIYCKVWGLLCDQGLQHFRCRGCLLSTPADLPVLPSVKTLDLGDNLLIQLPPAAEFWPRLVVLLVDGNRLSSLPDLPAQLAELSLASNNFTRIQFDKLRRVRSLDLSDNRLLTSDVLTMLEVSA